MTRETPEEEIRRLESEIDGYSRTFVNTDPADMVTRPRLQAEMDARTRRIEELKEGPAGLSGPARFILGCLAGGAAWGAWNADGTGWTIGFLVAAFLCALLAAFGGPAK